jgi:branched-chain amino acid aminotransferase
MTSAAPTRFPLLAHPGLTSAQDRAKLLANPGFGRVFTDHMASLEYLEGEGWRAGAIRPRAPLTLDPAAAVFHYAQEIFEGLKAYRAEDGRVLLFRPEANAERFRASARRLAMPDLPTELFIGAVEALVGADRDWIPSGAGSLYLRPFMIATEPFLGVRPSREYQFLVIASPVGSYFSETASGVTIWTSQAYTRAVRGGTGAAKCGGNYASGLLAQAEAHEHGCDQVLFLDAVERRWIEELGGMNLFFVFEDGALLTPPLQGSILPGVTRNSIIALSRRMGREVREEPYEIEALRADARSGRLREVFACGTAAVLTPVKEFRGDGFQAVIAQGEVGPVTAALLEQLTDIQRGRAPDPFGWVRSLKLESTS